VARKVVGLDIGTTAVRAAEVSVRRGQVVLERIGQAGLPEGVVVDGEVVEPGAVAIAIKDLWRRTKSAAGEWSSGWPTSGWSCGWSTCPGWSPASCAGNIVLTVFQLAQSSGTSSTPAAPAGSAGSGAQVR
jgi:hypothetical protein